MRETVVAAALVGLAAMILGTDWRGVEVQPGLWRDGVTPVRWLVFGIAIFVIAGGVAAWIDHGRRRLLVLVPLLAWVLWQLRVGTLWPVAFVIYATGIVACWVTGLIAGRWLWARAGHTQAPGAS